MELYQLRTFKMVAEEGHLTRAAKRLNASQPAVSAHIKTLEDELGIQLFLRNPKGMTLTSDGEKLMEYALRVLTDVDALTGRAERLRGNICGKLRIGMNTEPDSLMISELFSTMKKLHPDIELHLLQSMTGDVLNKLEDGLLDAGFMYGDNESDKIFVMELAKLQLVVAGASKYQKELKHAKPADLGRFPWIMTPENCPFHTVASNMFKQFGIEPEQIALVDQESTLKSMITAGVGVSLLLKHTVSETDLAFWQGENLFLTLSISCLTRRKDDPLLQTLFGVLNNRIWNRA